MLPVIEELDALKTDAERADWLVRCPDGVIVGYCGTITAAIERSGFSAALRFLQARYAACWALRTPQGQLPNTVHLTVLAAEWDMKQGARP